MAAAAQTPALIVSAGSCVYALPLPYVVETMRPLPVESIPGTPPFVRGLAVIRGVPTAVIDLRLLLEPQSRPAPPGRFVTLRVGHRTLAVGVDGVVGLRVLEGERLTALPALLRHVDTSVIEAIGTQDAGLLVVLHAARLIPDDVWAVLDAPGAAA